jgi:hypothetical protein
MMVIVGADKAVKFVAHSVHNVVASTFDFVGWDLHIPGAEIVEVLGTYSYLRGY